MAEPPRQPHNDPVILQDCVRTSEVPTTEPVKTTFTAPLLVTPVNGASRPPGNSQLMAFTLVAPVLCASELVIIRMDIPSTRLPTGVLVMCCNWSLWPPS